MKMMAKAHRHNGGCGRNRHCCKDFAHYRGSRPLGTIRHAQRAYERQEVRRDVAEELWYGRWLW